MFPHNYRCRDWRSSASAWTCQLECATSASAWSSSGPSTSWEPSLAPRKAKVQVLKHPFNFIFEYIWVSFCRMGKMSKIWPFFWQNWSVTVTNGLIFSSFLIFSEEIMSLGVYKYFCFGPSNSLWFLKISCFRPKILFSAIFWGQSKAAL